ncbi:protein ALTERED XYLOGLUCAN 4-like [Eutrema salsugineum]|uniref:protein ALTERED XYLOGLUCAN 4-like n=1 Tax=Eutrema salsugineum TaxID=72664 RepID=UPI000CED63D3|nr:protein ALTERED XYLOGLUCAN 4-like [Eutrema salsugineum]
MVIYYFFVDNYRHATMSSWSIFRENFKKVITVKRLTPYFLFCITLFFITHFFFPRNPYNPIKDQNVVHVVEPQIDLKDCDLSKGEWVPDQRGSLYTNSSCLTIPDSKNCLKHGRPNIDFLFWRWRPESCDLPRFNPKAFLDLVRGKKMNFIGDSVARNHMESLLCLLSMEETPKDIYKDAEDRNRIWYFPGHDFTLSTSWTKFLVAGYERTYANKTGTGIYDLDIDKIDEKWARDLPNTDIAIVSAGHWLFRPIYIHKGDETIGCIYCNLPNMTQIHMKEAFKLIFSAAFKHINACHHCKESLVTVLRTFSASQFENGTWNTGGSCARMNPFRLDEIDLKSSVMEFRTSQMEQLEEIKRGSSKKKFAALDVTKVMLMRPDGHPNSYWGNPWMKGFNDCTHWCLPGPIDTWSEFLMELLRQLM